MDIKPSQPQQQNQQNMYGQQPMNQAQPGFNTNPNMQNHDMNRQMPVQPKMKKSHRFIFGYIFIVILLLAVGGVYYWQHKLLTSANSQNATLNSQIMTQQSQISSLNDKLKALNAKISTIKVQAPTAGATSAATTLSVPELGITINNIPVTLAGLNYTYDKTTSKATFSTTGLTTADPKCASTAGTGIGDLKSSTGTYSMNTTKLPTGETFIKQVSNSYLVSNSSVTQCSTTAVVNTTQAAQAKLFQTLISTSGNIK